MNNIKVDKTEYAKQLYKKIKDTNKYLEINLIVPQVNNEKEMNMSTPISSMDIKEAGAIEIAMAINALKKNIEILLDYPYVKEALEYINLTKDIKTLKFNDKGELKNE